MALRSHVESARRNARRRYGVRTKREKPRQIFTSPATMQKETMPYRKALVAAQKEKTPYYKTEPKPNQREVHLTLKASGTLPKPKPMWQVTLES